MSDIPEDLSHLDLPPDVLERLSELDLELAEGMRNFHYLDSIVQNINYTESNQRVTTAP